jgi:glycosyltransferase involved in cell wall biosynthesis
MKNTLVVQNCYVNIAEPLTRTNVARVKVITVGRFVAQKDYTTALLCAAELKKKNMQFEYHIVGWGELEGQIRDKVKELALDDVVTIHINPPRIPELLVQSDIYLSTSLFEGTSNAIMEAMDASLPIVATNVGDNNRLVVEQQNGYLHQVGDVPGITESLVTLIKDRGLRNTMGISSNTLLKSNYSVGTFKEKYLEIIRNSNTKTRK